MLPLILVPVVIAASVPPTSSSSIRIGNGVSCEDDLDCRYGLDYCIDNKCYQESDYGQQCDYARQCQRYQGRETCTNGTCQCESNYKYVANLRRCIPLEYLNCEY